MRQVPWHMIPGGPMDEDLNAGNKRITNLADPSSAQDAVTKAWLQANAQAYDADLTTLGAGGTGARDFLGIGTANTVQFAKLGIGAAVGSASAAGFGGTPMSGTSQYGVNFGSTFGSDATSAGYAFISNPATAAAVFTMPSLYHFYAANVALGSGSVVGTQYGFYTPATFNNGSTANWGVYIDGTTKSYFGGLVGIGVSPLYKLHVKAAGTANAYDGQILVFDSQAVATGIGGRIKFGSIYTAAGVGSNDLGFIGIAKENATDEYGFSLVFGSRDNGASPTEKMRITGAGNMGIGLTPVASAGLLQILTADNGICANLKINATQANVTAGDVYVNFASTSGVEASITGTASAGVIAYNTFTGSHWSQSQTITAQKTTEDRTRTRTVYDIDETTGEQSAPREETYTEKVSFYRSDVAPGTVLVSTDEICAWDGEVAAHLPKCAVSTLPMDKAVYGVYGGHDNDGDILVLGVGAGSVLVCDEGGPIAVGDFLCTSIKPGHAMRYDGNDMRVVLGKARQSLEAGDGLIACTYLAG